MSHTLPNTKQSIFLLHQSKRTKRKENNRRAMSTLFWKPANKWMSDADKGCSIPQSAKLRQSGPAFRSKLLRTEPQKCKRLRGDSCL